jgi:hypothetical protein
MTGTEFYWTVDAALGGGCWAIMSSVRDRTTQAIERSRQIIDNLRDGDRLVIEYPDIPKYLSANASKDEQYFRSPVVLADEQ